MKPKDLIVDVGRKNLKIGIKGRQMVIDGELSEEVKVGTANWMIEDGKAVVLTLDKVFIFYYFLLIKFGSNWSSI